MDCPLPRRCELDDLDYSNVEGGVIACTACAWGWVLDEDGWKRTRLR